MAPRGTGKVFSRLSGGIMKIPKIQRRKGAKKSVTAWLLRPEFYYLKPEKMLFVSGLLFCRTC